MTLDRSAGMRVKSAVRRFMGTFCSVHLHRADTHTHTHTHTGELNTPTMPKASAVPLI